MSNIGVTNRAAEKIIFDIISLSATTQLSQVSPSHFPDKIRNDPPKSNTEHDSTSYLLAIVRQKDTGARLDEDIRHKCNHQNKEDGKTPWQHNCIIKTVFFTSFFSQTISQMCEND